MNSTNRRQRTALAEITKICAAHADIFRGNPVAEQMLAKLHAASDSVEAASAAFESARAAARNATVARKGARDGLRGALKAIAHTGPVVAIQAGATARFKMPKGCSDLQLADIAKDFVDRATRFADKFAEHKLPANVIADLPARIAALRGAMDDQTAAHRAHKSARQVYLAQLKSSAEPMDALERIYMNAFGGDTKAVSDWKSARRIGPSRTADVPAAAPAQAPGTPSTTTPA
ncbi:MAG TPA: hypothetical protein VGY57_01365 [Vicinamibacterales bacterium]|nr:hypothetical protein [Vicinamibacterales bacterium]